MTLQMAYAALKQGDLNGARQQFEHLCQSQPSIDAWLGLSDTARQQGDKALRLHALDTAQAINANDLRVLVFKGDYYDDIGDKRQAGAFYGQALSLASQSQQIPPQLNTLLQRAQTRCTDYAREYQAYLDDHLKPGADEATAELDNRFDYSLDIMFGRKPVYAQQPTQYFFPGLPSQPFYDRNEFAWSAALEAATSDIRTELLNHIQTDIKFRPYVERNTDSPRADHAGMMDNPGWSALFLWRDGEPVNDILDIFPKTKAAMEQVNKANIPGHSPTVLFSLLKSGVRIPPHTGLMNTRLICHLPLIIPNNCAIRVGPHTEQWIDGQVMVFDDSMEHEAWNNSTENRYVLIFDTPNPNLSAREHDRVAALFSAINSY